MECLQEADTVDCFAYSPHSLLPPHVTPSNCPPSIPHRLYPLHPTIHRPRTDNDTPQTFSFLFSLLAFTYFAPVKFSPLLFDRLHLTYRLFSHFVYAVVVYSLSMICFRFFNYLLSFDDFCKEHSFFASSYD